MLSHQRPWVVLKKLCTAERCVAPKRRRGVVATSLPSQQATGSLASTPASFSKAVQALVQGGLSEAEARAFLAFGKKLPLG